MKVTGACTICGKNQLQFINDLKFIAKGITSTVTKNGYQIKLNGTTNSSAIINQDKNIQLPQTGTYYLVCQIVSGSFSGNSFTFGVNFGRDNATAFSQNQNEKIVEINATKTLGYMPLFSPVGTTFDNLVINMQVISKNELDLNFEPYQGQTITSDNLQTAHSYEGITNIFANEEITAEAYKGEKGYTYDDTELKNDISSINTNIKANYYNKADTDTKLDTKANTSDVYNKTETDEKLESKQDKLIAGTGIEITEENTINNIQGNYSTDEIRIGTWINGKPLYRKVINAQFGTVVQGTETTVEVNFKNVDFILVDKYWLDRISSKNAINQGYIENSIFLGYTSINSSDSTVRFRTKQSWVSNVTVYAIIIYTKTTD